MTLLAVLLFGCSKGWDARCNETLNNLCTLRVACGQEASFPECQENLANFFVCDTTVIEQAFDPCIVKLEEYIDADPPVCFDVLPSECADVLCDTTLGCDFVTPTGYSEHTGSEGLTPPHTGTTGGTGGT